jgi:YHS domain-containing protein
VLDSGTRRLVFVEQGEGVFVPRTVRTGRRLGERVEIVGGLMEGESVVTSGNFLLDSESRMRAAGAAAAGASLDPICGMEVEESKARAAGLVSEHGGKTWFFCTETCKRAFDHDPKAASARAQGVTEPMMGESHAALAPSKKAFHMQDPVCGMDVDPDEAERIGLVSTFKGGRFSFCSPACKETFDRDPSAALSRSSRERAMPSAPGAGMSHEGGQGGMTAPMPGQMPTAGHVEGHAPGRMGAAEAATAKDPFCQMEVDVAKARAAGLFSEYNGATWYFDSEECKKGFDDDPRTYLPMVR